MSKLVYSSLLVASFRTYNDISSVWNITQQYLDDQFVMQNQLYVDLLEIIHVNTDLFSKFLETKLFSDTYIHVKVKPLLQRGHCS